MEYESHYDNPLLRGIDDPMKPRPWDLINEIKACSDTNKNLLDIGCGTLFKTVKLAPNFEQIVALDISESMIAASKSNLQAISRKNIMLVRGNSKYLPFVNNSFDVISCMLSRWEISEIHRVLKNSGIAIIEHIGCEDKKSFKIFFGKDGNNYRGQLINETTLSYIHKIEREFKKYFNDVTITNGFWNTYYTIEGLKLLLSHTPTIANYHPIKDENLLKNAILHHSNSNNEIKLTQNRILIYARKY